MDLFFFKKKKEERKKFLADDSESRTCRGWGGRVGGIWGLCKVQPALFSARTWEKGDLVLTSQLPWKSKENHFPGDDSLNLGSLTLSCSPTDIVWLLLQAQTPRRFVKTVPK